MQLQNGFFGTWSSRQCKMQLLTEADSRFNYSALLFQDSMILLLETFNLMCRFQSRGF